MYSLLHKTANKRVMPKEAAGHPRRVISPILLANRSHTRLPGAFVTGQDLPLPAADSQPQWRQTTKPPELKSQLALLRSQVHHFGGDQEKRPAESPLLLAQFVEVVWSTLGLSPVSLLTTEHPQGEHPRVVGENLLFNARDVQETDPHRFALNMQRVLAYGLAEAARNVALPEQSPQQLQQAWLEQVYKVSAPVAGLQEKHQAHALCCQPYILVQQVEGPPTRLRLLPHGGEREAGCALLFGVLPHKGMYPTRLHFHMELQDMRWNDDILPIWLPTFWQCISRALTDEGKRLFRAYNMGLPVPATAEECHQRLLGFSRWVQEIGAQGNQL